MKENSPRKLVEEILENLDKFENYSHERDYPNFKTTELAKYLKFGVVSPREVYYKIKEKLTGKSGEAMVRQLYWRDFFTQAGFHFPKIMQGKNFYAKYDKVKWIYDKNNPNFKKFCQGKTGFPIVDAGIRELLKTGYMSNRVRMITASFLTKDLHFHWTLGEKFFARHLLDYDPIINNSSWQWASSTGFDAQPYFRIFNPHLQQKKFDPQCEYIKKWIVELKEKPDLAIHDFENTDLSPYPRPIIDHRKEKEITLQMFNAMD